jgi:hypothetical protein
MDGPLVVDAPTNILGFLNDVGYAASKIWAIDSV